MTIRNLIKKLPDYSEDIKLNLEELFLKDSQLLTKQQLYGVALSIGYSLKHEVLLNSIRGEAKMFLEEIDAQACKIAVVMMSMNNTYYNFAHNVSVIDLANINSGLHMQSVLHPMVDPMDFELYCLAVSILNGCKYCVDVHTKKLIKRGFEILSISYIARIVSVLRATRDSLEIERMRSYDFIAREPSIE